jgi:hypothetical protein
MELLLDVKKPLPMMLPRPPGILLVCSRKSFNGHGHRFGGLKYCSGRRDMLPGGNLEDIVPTAREAMKIMGNEGLDEEYKEEEEESFKVLQTNTLMSQNAMTQQLLVQAI